MISEELCISLYSDKATFTAVNYCDTGLVRMEVGVLGAVNLDF